MLELRNRPRVTCSSFPLLYTFPPRRQLFPRQIRSVMNSGTGNGWVTVGKVSNNPKSKKKGGKENKKIPKPVEVVPQCECLAIFFSHILCFNFLTIDPPEFMDFLEGEKPIPKPKLPVEIKVQKEDIAEKAMNGGMNGGSPKKVAKKKAPKEFKQVLKMTTNPQFEKDVRKFNLDDLVSMLETTKTHYPSTKLIWLKDVAAYLNHCIPYEVVDSIFEGKPLGKYLETHKMSIIVFISDGRLSNELPSQKRRGLAPEPDG